MGRERWKREVQHPKPVEKIELSEKNVGLRFTLLAVLIIVAVISFGYGINQLLSVETGWTEIEADSSAEANSSNEFVLLYNLGSRQDMSVTAENKAIIALYTDVMEQAYQLFHNNQEIENVNNIYYINSHPNQEIVVEDMLYQAFELIDKYQDRTIYLAPVFEQYDDIFYCEDDSQTAPFDPYKNDELALEFAQMAAYANDATAVNIELLGDNKIKLHVSEEYLAYCEENGITCLVDFSWMKNAFIVDYLAEVMISEGFTAATISSYDGYSRNLDTSETEFAFNLYDSMQGSVIQAATAQYSGIKSIVSMRAFPINNLEVYRYYEFSNGEIRTSYLDVADGLCKNATSSLYAYADDLGCAEILLKVSPIYISETLDKDALVSLIDDGIYSVYVSDKLIVYNEEKLHLSGVYTSYTTNYVK